MTGADATEPSQELRAERDAARAELAAMQATISWRVTAPLRRLRRRTRTPGEPPNRYEATSTGVSEASGPARLALTAARCAAVELLDPQAPAGGTDPDVYFSDIVAAIERTSLEATSAAWLGLFAATARYPGPELLDAAAQRLRMFGPAGFADLVEACAALTVVRPLEALEVVRDRVLVDVTHTLSTGLNTGVQRVAREAVAGWRADHPEIVVVAYDAASGCWRRARTGALDALGAAVDPSGLDDLCESAALLPWRCRLLLPEIAGEVERCDSYRAARAAGVLESIAIIGFDLVPVAAPETVSEGMGEYFGRYLSVVKHADRIGAISASSAAAFRAFGVQCAAAGLGAPQIRVISLGVRPGPTEAAINSARRTFAPDDRPVVLVVGSHEPRKNHGRVLEAAEQLWSSGSRFRLVFIGGNTWRSASFDALVRELRARGRPVEMHRQPTDDVVSGAYALARFTVFPSLIEGFGLPIVESLGVGTPVITSNHGSMAELAAGGGCLTVDPRDVSALAHAMELLLRDDGLHERLSTQARSRPARSWQDFSREAWSALTSV